MAKLKKEHVKNSEEQTTEEVQKSPEELETLSEEETVEQVSELLKDEQAESTEEQTKETEIETEVEESSEEEEAPVPMIDDEFVKKYPATKTHYGKPVTDLGQPYQSIVKEFYDTSKELSEVKKKLAKATIPKIEDEPDPVEKPDEHAKWTKEREEAIRVDERNKIVQQPAQVDYVTEVGKQLPADVDANKVIESWSNVNAYKLFDNLGNWLPEVQLLYENRPQIFVRDVIEYYKAASKINKTEEEIRKAGHTKVKDDFKKARKEKKNMPNSDVHVVERESTASADEEQLQSLYKIVQEDNS